MNNKNSQPYFDKNSLGFPSSNSIIYNLQSLANYAMMNGGEIKMPFADSIPGLPLTSMVIHVYNDKKGERYINARVMHKAEYCLDKMAEKGKDVCEKPADDGKES